MGTVFTGGEGWVSERAERELAALLTELERERDEARTVARVYRLAWRGDTAAAAVAALSEQNYAWLTQGQPASELREERGQPAAKGPVLSLQS